jgi:hypothetical protein
MNIFIKKKHGEIVFQDYSKMIKDRAAIFWIPDADTYTRIFGGKLIGGLRQTTQ